MIPFNIKEQNFYVCVFLLFCFVFYIHFQKNCKLTDTIKKCMQGNYKDSRE